MENENSPDLESLEEESQKPLNNTPRAALPQDHLARSKEVPENYFMRISRLTIDKLGVKLYDKVSAVVAELIANGYDADATRVDVSLPLNSALATHTQDGVDEKGYAITVEDDGHGMTPAEAEEFYMSVGRDRRKHDDQGESSREKKRPVMGRKGIGKLAPFGVCKSIEVISAGGPKGADSYLVSHFKLHYDQILADTDEQVRLPKGPRNGEYAKKRGTKIILRNFFTKRVPDEDTFRRQLSRRFIFAKSRDFEIWVEDSRSEGSSFEVDPLFDIPLVEETKIDASKHPVETESGKKLKVEGWLAMAKNAYKNEESTGVRIYARNKFVAMTRDFEQPSGFTGEFAVRSYLVGEIHAEWLDDDDGEDLIRSDRQGIIWESEYGRALRKWGAKRIREIGRIDREPRRKRVSDRFMEESDFENKARQRFRDSEVSDAAIRLGKRVGAFAAEDELQDPKYVDSLAEVLLTVAPHKALIDAFRAFREETTSGFAEIDDLVQLFGKVSVAEVSSYSQIASERVNAINELAKIVLEEETEDEFQELLERAPWLVDPTWSAVTKNQSLKTFRERFKKFYGKKWSQDMPLEKGFEKKRPDFTMVTVSGKLHVVEIKGADHEFDNKDFERLQRYVFAFEDFFQDHSEFIADFPKGWQIDLVADGVNLTNRQNRDTYETWTTREIVVRSSWTKFLKRARKAHELFLEAHDTAQI